MLKKGDIKWRLAKRETSAGREAGTTIGSRLLNVTRNRTLLPASTKGASA